MPYEGEFAHYKPLHRLVGSERVRKLLGSYRVREHLNVLESPQALELADVRPSDWIPSWVVAIDGSHAEVAIRNGFPGAEASYVTVASILLNVAKRIELDRHRPVDPQEFRDTEQAESIDCALPGCNVVMQGEPSATASFRKSVFEVFRSVRMAPDGESLLDTYEVLLKYKPPAAREQRCPYEDCPIEGGEYRRGQGKYACNCSHARPLYSSDALRIHEGMQPAGTNGAMFAEIMQVWERVWVVHILRTLEGKRWLSTLRRLAIVLDGPLAVFGHPAWLSQAIRQELSRLNAVAKQSTKGQDILLVGVEKSGRFVEHLTQLDRDENGSVGRYPFQSAALITDSYIKQNIVFSESSKPYGEDTYFGRKLFYKTMSGALIVATLPFFADEHGDTTRAHTSQYPRIADAMSLLDRLFSSRYPNALAPLVSAHAEAAIPLHLGNRVLERLARELMADAYG